MGKKVLLPLVATVALAFGAGGASASSTHSQRASWNTDWSCFYDYVDYMGWTWVDEHEWDVLTYCDYSNGG